MAVLSAFRNFDERSPSGRNFRNAGDSSVDIDLSSNSNPMVFLAGWLAWAAGPGEF
jgi:hypothetical protein